MPLYPPRSSGGVDGTGTAGRITEWLDADTVQASTLIKSGAGVLTLDAGGAYTLTVPATGTTALLATSNLFTVRQDVRASGAAQAAGLYVPWISGDTLPTVKVGSQNSANNDTGLRIDGYSGTGLDIFLAGDGNGAQIEVQNGSALFATTNGYGVALDLVSYGSGFAARYRLIKVNDNAVIEAVRFQRATIGGAGASGIGLSQYYYVEDTAGAAQLAAQDEVLLSTATAASWKARRRLIISDSAGDREAMRLEASGSAAMLGFLGATASAREAVAAAATDLATAITLVNDLRAKLITKGLIS